MTTPGDLVVSEVEPADGDATGRGGEEGDAPHALDAEHFPPRHAEVVQVHRLDRDLLSLEQGQGGSTSMNNIFRVIHTLKGTAGCLGFHRIEKLSHVGENILDALRNGTLPSTPPIAAALLRLSDGLRSSLQVIASTGRDDTGPNHDTLIAEINTTPLVDVMLVLLIIFLITIPVVTQTIKLELPKERNLPTQTKPENIVGNGAYTLAENTPGERVVAKRNPNYWDNEHTVIEEVQWLTINDENQGLTRWRAGEVDQTDVPAGQYTITVRPVRTADGTYAATPSTFTVTVVSGSTVSSPWLAMACVVARASSSCFTAWPEPTFAIDS